MGDRAPMTGRTFENTREDIDRAIEDFSVQMVAKLLLTRHRTHWMHCDADLLLKRLHDEVRELDVEMSALVNAGQPLDSHKRKAIIRECADVANFAMMIADKMTWAGTRTWLHNEGGA